MNEKSLEKNLANIERELVALQTAHDIGLGAVGFYVYEGTFMTFSIGGGSDWPIGILLIDVVGGERSDPLMDVHLSSIFENNESGFANAERYNSMKFDFYVSRPFYTQMVRMYYRVVSSSRLTVRAAESYQDYVDWLDE